MCGIEAIYWPKRVHETQRKCVTETINRKLKCTSPVINHLTRHSVKYGKAIPLEMECLRLHMLPSNPEGNINTHASILKEMPDQSGVSFPYNDVTPCLTTTVRCIVNRIVANLPFNNDVTQVVHLRSN